MHPSFRYPLQILYEARDWKGLQEYVVLLSKRRSQLKQAVQVTITAYITAPQRRCDPMREPQARSPGRRRPRWVNQTGLCPPPPGGAGDGAAVHGLHHRHARPGGC